MTLMTSFTQITSVTIALTINEWLRLTLTQSIGVDVIIDHHGNGALDGSYGIEMIASHQSMRERWRTISIAVNS
jgi:hypothetical protein